MRDIKEAEKEAREILKEQYDLTAGEIDALHNMDEWDKITTAFYLGVDSGAKSAAEKEPELIKALQTLPEDELNAIRNHAEDLLIERAADRFKICGCCGSRELSRDGHFVLCKACGAGGGIKIDRQGRVRLYWD